VNDGIEVVETSWYRAELALLPRADRLRVERKVRTVRSKKWSEAVADRSIAPLMDGIYEVRVLGRGAAYRLLFFVAPGRAVRAVVLTACVNKSVMKKRAGLAAEIARAKARRQAWVDEQEKNNEG
jgi:hypothetical protein